MQFKKNILSTLKTISNFFIHYKTALFLLFLLLLMVPLFWKCKFGYVSADEAAYVSMPFRFLQGDMYFKDEYILIQTSTFPILPLVSSILSLKASTDGLMLTMRYAYTLVKLLVALFLFFKFRKTSFCGAALSSLCFILFTPFNIEQLSYNTLCQIGLILSACIVFSSYIYNNKKNYPFAFAGLFFAISVLCCPPLIFLYFILSILILALCKANKLSIIKKWFFFSLGALILAIIFFTFIFTKVTLSDLLHVIQFILSDPAHSYNAFNPFGYFINIWNSFSLKISNNTIPLSKIFYSIYLILFVFVLFQKKAKKGINQKQLFIFLALISCSHLILSYVWLIHWNSVVLPLNILSLFIFLLTDNDLIRKLFISFWVPGMAYSYIINFTSNTEYYGISSASMVALVGSIMMIVLFIKEISLLFYGRKIPLFLCSFLLFFTQLSVECIAHFNRTFGDYTITSGELNCRITNGSLKGITTCPFLYDAYDKTQYDLSIINTDDSINSILYLYCFDWFYLNTPNKRNSSPCTLSSLLILEQEYLELFLPLYKEYYSKNPDKRPDFVYFSDIVDDPVREAGYERFKSELFSAYTVEKMSNGIGLRK